MGFAFFPQTLGKISAHLPAAFLRFVCLPVVLGLLLVHFGFSVLLPNAFPGEILLLHIRICLEKVEKSGGSRDHQKWSVSLDTTCTVVTCLKNGPNTQRSYCIATKQKQK